MRNSANHVIMEIEASKPGGNGMVVGGLSPLSETLWKEKTDTEFIGDVSARLTWKDRSDCDSFTKQWRHTEGVGRAYWVCRTGELDGAYGSVGFGEVDAPRRAC